MTTFTVGYGLDAFFEANSIAIIGASEDVTKIGGRPLYFLRLYGYQGTIYPINPNRSTVQTITAYASILDTPTVPELVVLATPAHLSISALQECANKGVKAVVVLSSGFSEASPEGEQLQEQLQQIAKKYAMRLLGPNCLGAFDINQKVISSFSIILEKSMPQLGSIGVVSQSGNIGSYTVQHISQRNMGVSRFIATGNEADIDIADGIAALAKDPNTHIILCCMETCRQAEKLIAAFEIAHKNNKPIFILKIGSTEQGQAAAASHTGALASPDAIIDAVFNRYGVIRVFSIEELLDLAQAASLLLPNRLPKTNAVTLVAASGGFGVMMADATANAGLQLAIISPTTQQRIATAIPLASTSNPIDATAQMSSRPDILYNLLAALMEERNSSVTQLFLALSMSHPRLRDVYLQTLNAIRKQYPDQLLVITCPGPQDAIQELQQLGIPVFPSIEATAKGIAHLVRLQTRSSLPQEKPSSLTSLHLDSAVFSNEWAAKKALLEQGINTPDEVIVQSADEAIDHATRIGFPVVLKVISPDIQHKTEVGGVELNLNSAQMVRDAFQKITSSVRRLAPQATITGFLISPMETDGIELIIGTYQDPVFGPIVMTGMGGIYAELLQDIALRKAPISQSDAEEMLASLKLFPLLNGARGKEKSDIQAAAKAISTLSEFATQHKAHIAEIDMNPVLVKQQGQGITVLDALFIPTISYQETQHA